MKNAIKFKDLKPGQVVWKSNPYTLPEEVKIESVTIVKTVFKEYVSHVNKRDVQNSCNGEILEYSEFFKSKKEAIESTIEDLEESHKSTIENLKLQYEK